MDWKQLHSMLISSPSQPWILKPTSEYFLLAVSSLFLFVSLALQPLWISAPVTTASKPTPSQTDFSGSLNKTFHCWTDCVSTAAEWSVNLTKALLVPSKWAIQDNLVISWNITVPLQKFFNSMLIIKWQEESITPNPNPNMQIAHRCGSVGLVTHQIWIPHYQIALYG